MMLMLCALCLLCDRWWTRRSLASAAHCTSLVPSNPMKHTGLLSSCTPVTLVCLPLMT